MLDIENVSKKYVRRSALKNATFHLKAGKTCLFLGPNGSGKTTLMKMIAGLTQPSGGAIRFDGMPIGLRTKTRIAYMPTENYFYNYMTVADAGKYYRDFFPDFRMKKFNRMLSEMELDPKDRIRQLSSGMAAKLRLALILSRNADLMMFDEPLNGVDILTRKQVIDAILENRREKRSMIISTHLVDELEDAVDYVVCLKKGKVALAGEYAQVCAGKTLRDLYLEVYGKESAEPVMDEAEDEAEDEDDD